MTLLADCHFPCLLRAGFPEKSGGGAAGRSGTAGQRHAAGILPHDSAAGQPGAVAGRQVGRPPFAYARRGRPAVQVRTSVAASQCLDVFVFQRSHLHSPTFFWIGVSKCTRHAPTRIEACDILYEVASLQA